MVGPLSLDNHVRRGAGEGERDSRTGETDRPNRCGDAGLDGDRDRRADAVDERIAGDVDSCVDRAFTRMDRYRRLDGSEGGCRAAGIDERKGNLRVEQRAVVGDYGCEGADGGAAGARRGIRRSIGDSRHIVKRVQNGVERGVSDKDVRDKQSRREVEP